MIVKAPLVVAASLRLSAGLSVADSTNIRDRRVIDLHHSAATNINHRRTHPSSVNRAIMAQSADDGDDHNEAYPKEPPLTDPSDVHRETPFLDSIFPDQPPSPSPPPLSKTQQKKLRKRETVAEARRLRKLREREQKIQRAQEEGRDLLAEEAHQIAMAGTSRYRQKRQQYWETHQLPLAQQESFQICVDCSFESHLTSKEIASLASQLRYCYAANKACPHPCLWTATSLTGPTLLELQKLAVGYDQWSNRAYTGTSDSLEDYYQDKLNKIVYLTSDSPNTLTDLDKDAIYVIGGIVDRNRLPNATLRRAQSLGVATAKLPLEQHLVHMPTTRVLTCNHVFQVLLEYRQQNSDWGRALQRVLPRRKEAQFKTAGPDNDNNVPALTKSEQQIREARSDTPSESDWKESENASTTTRMTSVS